MTLSQCRIGEIVREIHVSSDRRIGHVTGLTANSMGEIIPLIRWATSDKDIGVHHGNLRLLSDTD